MKLRPYQAKSVAEVLAAFANGDDQGPHFYICMPTGSGKTIVMMYALHGIWARLSGEGNPVEPMRQTLILVPTISIAMQTKSQAEKVLRKQLHVNCSIELEQGANWTDETADLWVRHQVYG